MKLQQGTRETGQQSVGFVDLYGQRCGLAQALNTAIASLWLQTPKGQTLISEDTIREIHATLGNWLETGNLYPVEGNQQ